MNLSTKSIVQKVTTTADTKGDPVNHTIHMTVRYLWLTC